jgi:hypothetical protein
VPGEERSLNGGELTIDLEFRSQGTPPERCQALPLRDVGDSVLNVVFYLIDNKGVMRDSAIKPVRDNRMF